ncbi:pilin [Luteimonas dalianensis]
MLVVAIIALLATVALPAYRDYAIRARISEVILAGSVCRDRVSEVAQSEATLPSSNAWGCEVTSGQVSNYVGTITTNDSGVIAIQSLVPGATGIVRLSPYADTHQTTSLSVLSNVRSWSCDSPDIRGKHLPATCRN